jgi:uncharacterized membrane protein
VRVLGQSVNPLLTMLPLGLIGSSVLVDLGAAMVGIRYLSVLGHYELAVGLTAGVVSLCTLLVDLVVEPVGTRAREALASASALTGAMVIVLMIVWSVRVGGDYRPGGFMVFVEVLALVAGSVGAARVRLFGSDDDSSPSPWPGSLNAARDHIEVGWRLPA